VKLLRSLLLAPAGEVTVTFASSEPFAADNLRKGAWESLNPSSVSRRLSNEVPL
jgi:hypothetical protein